MSGRLGGSVEVDRPPPLGAVLGPLPLWAVGALTGAVLGERVVGGIGARGDDAGRIATAVAVVAAVGALALVAASLRSPSRHPSLGDGRLPVRYGVLALSAVVAVGVAGSTARIATTTVGGLPVLAAQGGSAELDVVVVHEPRPIATGWHVLYRVDAIDGTPTRERAAATLPGSPPTLGSRWRLTATARPLPDGGYGRWLARQHAAVAIDVREASPVTAPGRLVGASEHVRARVRTAATAHLPDALAGLLVGFVTGDTRLLPDAEADAMRATSLTHLTAVSGSNVAIVVAGVVGLTTLLRIGARGRRWAVGSTVAWFALVTRFEPSVLRAGTMAMLVLLAAARGVPRDARHALAGAVLVLVLIDPALAGSLGLLLSATATAGVLLVAPRVRLRLTRVPRRLAEVLAITIGAQLAVVPLLLASFGQVPLAAVPANVLAVPAAALSASLAFAATIVALVHLDVGAWLFAVAGQPARLVLVAAHLFADVGGVARVARPATVVAVAAGSLWLLARPGGRAAQRLAVLTAAAVVVASVPVAVGSLPARALTVTAIDVGQGDAFLVEAPGARVLVDAGPDDAAARWLRANGRRRLDLVVVTHAHADHVGGIPAVLGAVAVGAVWLRAVPTDAPQLRQVLDTAAQQGMGVDDPVAGDRVRIGELDVEVLGPPAGRPYRSSASELNDTSVVLRLSHGDRRVLLAGDVEAAAQRDLLAQPRALAADVLGVPHHGAATSDPAFLRAVGARVGLLSVGADNTHGHPAPTTLAVLAQTGTQVRRTDREGTIRLDVAEVAGVTEVTDVAGVTDVPDAGSSQAATTLSRHGRRAVDRGQRPARAAGVRTAARGAHRRGSRRPGRPVRRGRARSPPGAADRLAVRGTHGRGGPRCPGRRQGAA